MSVVFVGSSGSVFVSRTQAELIRRGVEVSLIDLFSEATVSSGVTGLLAKFGRSLSRYRAVRRSLKGYSSDSVAMVHSLSLDCIWLVPLLKTHFRTVIGMAYGSDILRRYKKLDPFLAYGLRYLDAVVATNENVLETIARDFPSIESRSAGIVRFGLPVFDELRHLDGVSSRQAKSALGFNPDRRLASLGYAASPGQRQLELIDFFSQRDDILRDLDFVVPIQYGPAATISAVKAKCNGVNANLGKTKFQPLTEFQSPDRAALMRRATDLLINHSITDAFSGTVQEVVYAGNLVLAASHLPYTRMPGFGTAILPYDSLDELIAIMSPSQYIASVHTAVEASAANRAALHATSSWDAVFPDWLRLLGLSHP